MAVTVVNMIPSSLSAETNRDSEPNVAIDRGNPLRLAASAFTPDPLASGSGPIFVSTDGGLTWALVVCLPGGDRTVDVTLRTGRGSRIYAGILRLDNSNMNILRKADFTAAGMMTVLVNRANEDQPWAEATSVLGGAGVNLDRGYVGHNDFNASSGRTATVETSVDAGTAAAPAGFAARRLEVRTTCGQDGPPIRPAIHPNGTIYAVFFRWTACTSVPFTADVVVVRDDNWASGATPYGALVDPGDSQPGRLVATGRSIPWFANLGTQRIGGQMAIAVDPRNSQTVYIAWADGTSAANFTIHVRRSTDGGSTWSGDLRTVSPATNPGLAITSRGEVGFLYQRLVGGNRWQTHLERSSDGFASAPSDLTLADVPDQNGSYGGANPIGDYANLIALGKDFYGAFSANNTPNNANFPQGVTYQRAANFGTNQLLDLSGNAVPVSIDPFFFKVTALAVDADFYVRDWTDSATSGDNGVEPSTHPVFYATSDVWNRRKKNDPGGFNANDQPINEYPKMGPGNSGRNFGFARIRRNAGGSAATVNAHFLVSPFGTGSVYQNAGTDPDLALAFAAGDLVKTPKSGYEWHLGSTMTDHVCFAVEITAPGDPVASPTLLGHAPGWPTTDLMVLNDNNKAQRNMYPPPSSGSGADSSFALIRNAATFTRDVVLEYHVDPAVHKRLGRIGIGVVGERGVKRSREGRLSLAAMAPGERRWVAVTTQARTGDGRTPLPILFYELVGNTAVNGFGIAPVPSSPAVAIRWNMELHMFRFGRLAAAFDVSEAKRQSAGARKLVNQRSITPAGYLRFLREHLEGVRDCIDSLVSQAGKDPFALAATVKKLGDSVAKKSSQQALPAHATLLNALDAFQTMLQLEEGDPASVLHNVEWQRELYTRVNQLAELPAAKAIIKASEDFEHGYEARSFGWEEFPRHIKRVLPSLRKTAEARPRLRLREPLETLERNLDSVAAAQRAHREFLLALQPAEPRESALVRGGVT